MNRLTDAQRSRVLSEACSWVGTPWHHMGRVKHAGVDCGMYILETYERVGLVPHSVPEPYPQDWAMHRSEEKYLAFVMQFGVRIDGPPRPADVVTFKIGRCISHAAIVIKWPTIIHSALGHGVIMDDAQCNAWFAERIDGFYTWDGESVARMAERGR